MVGAGKKAAVLLAAAVLMAPAVSVVGQNEYGPWTEVRNEYILVQMGQGGDAPVDDPYPIADRPRSGRWGVWTVKGDPETDKDDNVPLINCAADLGPGGKFGYTTIRVDGRNAIFGDPDSGSWVMPPYNSSKDVGNYIGMPPDSYHSGPYINSQFRVTEGNIFVQFRVVPIRDQVRFEVYLRNDDSASHSIGLRHLADVTTNGPSTPFGGDTVTYPFVPGRGIVMSETILTGTDIPDYLELFDDTRTPQVASRWTLRLEDATSPDRIAIGWWQNMQGNDWDYTTGLPDRIVPDYGLAVWWEPVPLGPGESRTIITYFGMAAASASWTSSSGAVGMMARQDPFCVAVQGPRALPISYSADKPPDEMLGLNPFKIKAYVYNLFRDIDLTNVSVHLTPSDGLELLEGQAPMQEIPLVPRESEGAAISWDVRCNGKVTGEIKYWVSASGNPGLQKTVTRTIMVPATGTTRFKQGWQMISVPFKFSDPRIEPALNFAPDTYRAYTYSPQDLEYQTATMVEPGKAFWLESSLDRTSATISRDGRPLSGAETYRIVLYSGWNQFGDPYIYPIPWGRVKVLRDVQIGPVTLEEAAARNWIRRTVYWWNTDLGEQGEYEYSSEPSTYLMPWVGYWVKALQPCQLIIPPVEQPSGGIGGDVARSRVSKASTDAVKSDGWRLKLAARAGNAVDSRSVLGVSSRASDLYDASDVERPPSHKDYVAISFPHRDWGVNSGSYMTDIRRAAGGDQTWEFEVASDQQSKDVVLTWPNLVDVPKSYTPKLVDIDAGVTKYMRTASSYRYSSGSGGVRRFRIVAQAGKTGRLLVTGLSVNTSRALGGATVSYNLSTDATADVRIKSLAGRTVRSLAKGRGVTRGISGLSWNYRDEAGRAVPAGSYLLEVVATTPEGEIAKAVHPFLVAR